MKKLFITVVLIVISTQLYAVEGYKSFKFGMSKSEVMKSGLCTLIEKPLNKSVSWFERLRCRDLKLFGEPKDAYFYFIEKKFLRIVINVSSESIGFIEGAIKKKYGDRTSPIDPIDIGAELKIPNNELWIGYDNNTVYIIINTNSVNKVFIHLVYTSPLYDDLLRKNKQSDMESDI